MKKSELLAFLIADGVSGDQLERLKSKYCVPKRQVKIDYDNGCPACGAEALKGDYTCGACSVVKVERERRFWQHADDRAQGFQGRVRAQKPRPQQLPPSKPRIELPHLAALRPEPIAVEQPKEIQFAVGGDRVWVLRPDAIRCREFLVWCGKTGRVVVAKNAAGAAYIAHTILGEDEKASHFVIPLGWTDEPETEPVCEVIRKKSEEPVDRRFLVSGPRIHAEVSVTGTNKVSL